MKHSAYGAGFYCFTLFLFFLFPFKSEDASVQGVLKTDPGWIWPCQISEEF